MIDTVIYSDRLEIERAFNEWALEHHVTKAPNTVVAFLQINGLLDISKTVAWCNARIEEKNQEPRQ